MSRRPPAESRRQRGLRKQRPRQRGGDWRQRRRGIVLIIVLIVVVVLSLLGSLVALASTVAPFTPTKKDDEALEYAKAHPVLSKVMALVLRFSIIQPKAK